MRQSVRIRWILVTIWAAVPLRLGAAEDLPSLIHPLYEEPVAAEDAEGRIRLVQLETTAVQPSEAELRTTPEVSGYQVGAGFDQVLTRLQEAGTIPAEAPPPAPATDSPTPASLAVLAAPDPGGLLKDAPTVQTVSAQRRNPVAFDPHVRGFRYGQIYSVADGIWFPVRTDLDSMLTKIDPSLISGMDVIPGPYGVRYGPAFAFINVQMAPSPRYLCGYESHGSLGSTYHHNGDQFYGRTSVYGGNDFWGYRMHYGNRTGSDYRSGDGTLVPSSYQSQTFLGQTGFDLSPHSRLEFRYQHLDQSDTEYALQFFDVDYLGSNAYSLSYINEDPTARWTRMRFETWHNITTFHGDNQNASKTPVRERVVFALEDALGQTGLSFFGRTNGSRSNFGARTMFTYGDDDWTQLHVGADVRYDDQQIDEHFVTTDAMGAEVATVSPIDTELPTSWLVDPGLFLELSMPLRPYMTTSIGGRVDWIRTGARASELPPIVNLSPAEVAEQKNDVLYAFFATTDLELTEFTYLRGGFGHAQRPPSLIERYSDGVFLGIMQSGFNRVVGSPNLDEERLWQADLTFGQNYDGFTTRSSVYYAWVEDFITYANNPVTAPAGARVLQATNTDLATIFGFELYGESDLTDMLTIFGALSYVEGEDEDIDQPLWGIAPLEGQFGLRLHDAYQGRYWGVELAGRFVDDQDRNAFIRRAGIPSQVDRLEQETPGFTTVTLRSYYNYSDSLRFVGGVENLFDNNYIEHLDLRLPREQFTNTFLPAEFAWAPGISIYTGFEWTR
jgi:iron complex outermembrane recepter protein